MNIRDLLKSVLWKGKIRGYREASEAYIRSMPAYPNVFSERGIVICGGGEKYFPSVWITINILRRLNCALPIQLWYLDEYEVNEDMKKILQPLGVECVNFSSYRNFYPTNLNCGWALKPYSILHCKFKEVIFIDADNVPVQDPNGLFESDEFKKTGAIFWPGYAKLAMTNLAWSVFGVEPTETWEFESGQIVIDKERCWHALCLTMWYNEHSDFYYKFVFGDKDTFLMAFLKLKRQYSLVDAPIHTLKYTMCQHDFSGQRIFQHRVGWKALENSGKWMLHGVNELEEDFWHTSTFS